MTDQRIPIRLHDTIEQAVTVAVEGFTKSGATAGRTQVAVEVDGRKLVVQLDLTVTEYAAWPQILPSAGVPGQPREPSLEIPR